MQINITGHHIDLTDAIHDYVDSKFAKLERHFDNITNVQVTLTVQNQHQEAEAIVMISGGELFAKAEDSNLYAAIDCLIDKLDRQIIKHKEKLQSRKQGIA
ncbi:ribosome hibernation-promoting factor, HPF/YfiA family [Motiliproteus sp. MSK22-1]|uniref:ribosome hibernation-promoting factor, HPF/YfiA family n=1 Tax=Motiliproteus sp. MSK22-1 TaxID=1897630 RepID=UPI00097728B4|nr:ribosome-associated translation inhibitor RaiA [Motiliproteus sp. MSK22-1]OMH30366.1 ribosomal subunit interface protein [Motiliproteus sp. MSK22-1]